MLTDPSASARETLARKLGRGYRARRFSAGEREIADDIVRAVARDVEIEVRKALAETISLSRDLPADVARELANDVASVAEPILRHSDVLADEDLVEVVRARSEAHRLAIAGRKRVSRVVSSSLADVGEPKVLGTLVDNAGADIDDGAFSTLIDRSADPKAMAMQVATRDRLPLATAERLIALISDRIRTRTGQAIDAEAQAGAALLLRGADTEGLDLMALVDRLAANKRLSAALAVRAADAGDAELALAALARRVNRSRGEILQLVEAAAAGFDDTGEDLPGGGEGDVAEDDGDGGNGNRSRNAGLGLTHREAAALLTLIRSQTPPVEAGGTSPIGAMP
ncbi:MAG: DUF2336 domain-containing protein [Pseudomonadota bacterium]